MSKNVIFNESFTDKILKIELNNLPKKNALSLEMLIEMASKLSQNNYIKKFKCVVITGTKKSAFSSGADLDDIRKLIASKNINFYHKKMDNLLKVITKLGHLPLNLLFKEEELVILVNEPSLNFSINTKLEF